jgi:YD repeat-containing protein
MSTIRQSMIAAGLTVAALSFPMAATAASTITYTYDVFGQLVSASSTAGRVATYTYDAAGNRTNLSATGATALNTPATETQMASIRQDASASAPAPLTYANNQNTDARQNDRDKSGSTGGLTTRALR